MSEAEFELAARRISAYIKGCKIYTPTICKCNERQQHNSWE